MKPQPHPYVLRTRRRGVLVDVWLYRCRDGGTRLTVIAQGSGDPELVAEFARTFGIPVWCEVPTEAQT